MKLKLWKYFLKVFFKIEIIINFYFLGKTAFYKLNKFIFFFVVTTWANILFI